MSSAEAGRSDPETALRHYASAFEATDADAIADRLVGSYHMPSMFVTPWGVNVFSNPEEARANVSQAIETMRAFGYKRTDCLNLETRWFASDLATVTGVFVRVGSDEKELNRTGFTYTMRLAEDHWKIVCAILHDVLAE